MTDGSYPKEISCPASPERVPDGLIDEYNKSKDARIVTKPSAGTWDTEIFELAHTNLVASIYKDAAGKETVHSIADTQTGQRDEFLFGTRESVDFIVPMPNNQHADVHAFKLFQKDYFGVQQSIVLDDHNRALQKRTFYTDEAGNVTKSKCWDMTSP